MHAEYIVIRSQLDVNAYDHIRKTSAQQAESNPDVLHKPAHATSTLYSQFLNNIAVYIQYLSDI